MPDIHIEDDPFTERALQIYEDAKSQIKYVASRFRQKVIKDGGLVAAKHWLRPSRTTKGFERLLDHDRLDLSVEAVALKSPWNQLFTKAELATARDRLEQLGYFNRIIFGPENSSELGLEDIQGSSGFPEGAKSQFLVSAYERNPAAREKCLKHYGTLCYICGFDFLKTYGEIGRGFIHVHHLTPLAATDSPRRTDPRTDLRPICPNCHAMLHRRTPPIPVAELKKLIGKS